MIPIPTARFYGLLGLGGLAALASAIVFPGDRSLGIALGGMLAWDVLLVGLAIVDAGRVRPHRVTASRDLPSRLSIGRRNAIALTFQTPELPPAFSPAVIRWIDSIPPELNPALSPDFDPARPPGLNSDLNPDLSPKIPTAPIRLEGQRSASLVYHVLPRRRCELSWNRIQLRQIGPWRLAWHDWHQELPQTTRVYPDLVGLRELTIKLALQSSGNLRQLKRQGMGTEFSELREYGSGDDLRLIDWKATARRGRPLVRVLEPEQEQTVLILLDRGRLMTAQVMEQKRFDWGVNAALSLALAALNRGDRVGLGIFDKTMHRWMPPEQGPGHLSKLLEGICAIQPELIEPDYLGAVSTVLQQQSRRALVVMITEIVDETASAELIGSLMRLSPRYLPFCVTLRDPKIEQQAQAASAPEDLGDLDPLYRRAVALDLLHQRQLVFAKLQQQGVLVLDAPAAQISDQLVERYLRLKARNRL